MAPPGGAEKDPLSETWEEEEKRGTATNIMEK